ncbi:DUF1203 domain-containing protein [Acidiferrimicrobium sp. IK]|uniref:DUF1203 domain-containing protein n=1 Tax=Acidiferrimicrobium sp. IK TaxID=2871700 RepID=UPI0021CB57DC|nr:DUF1203 domain-containing protein [Acidiferrimicrobium sp. IK]MCU4186320.1 DUF1203 domain-containing protein [Acidiferrimicrobium sp. IK]
MKTSFRIKALDAAYLEGVRSRGTDEFGNAVIAVANEEPGGTPLRCCLREAEIGEKVALIAHQPARIGGPYAEVGPVWIHADRCEGHGAPDAYPEGFRHRRLLFRAYDARGRQVDNRIAEGAVAEAVIDGLFSRPDVAYIHARNVLAGCYMFTVERASWTTPETRRGPTMMVG